MSTEKAAAAGDPSKSSRPGTSIWKRITHFLVSMKLALTLLFVIAILAIIGTILPQGDDVYQSNWVNSPLFDFYKTLDLFDMYSSWWFLSILGLLGANLTVCISRRLPTAIRHFMRPRLDVKDLFIVNQPLNAVIAGGGERGVARAREVFSMHRYRLRAGAGGAVMAERGRFAPLASIAFHMSFLLIAVGAISSSLLGFNEQLQIPDGATVAVPQTDLRATSHGFNVQYAEVQENGRITGYQPSSYSTKLEVFENGSSIARKTITVNGPLEVNGVDFHQSSYFQTSSGYVTILQVNREPGTNLVYAGFAMMVGGILVALYFPHRRVWIKAAESGDLLLGGRTNRARVSFEKEFDLISSEIGMTAPQEAATDGHD